MGVQDLLKLVDPLLRKGNIFALARGRRIGIDGNVILNRLAYALPSRSESRGGQRLWAAGS